MHVELRPLTPADIPAWVDLLNTCAVVDDTGEHFTADDLVEELDNPLLDAARDTFAADAGGMLVGYGQLVPWETDGTVHKLMFDAATHPAHRGEGIGTRLMEAMVTRAEAARDEQAPGAVRAWSNRIRVSDAAACDLVERFGFTAERWNVDMRAVLADVDPTPVSQVADLDVVTYDDRYADALLAAHNDAFVDHPNSSTWTPQMWEQWVTGSHSFRPELTFLAIPSDRDPDAVPEIAAYVQCAEYEATRELTGRRELWVSRVGTRRQHRGKGVAAALLGHTLAAAKAAGFDDAGLDVDSENPTGALGVYERVGFVVKRRWVDYYRRGA